MLYAVKCNPNLTVLKTLYEAGIRHFDTASLAEIADVREHLPQADCYFMHPVKARAAIQTAHQVYGVDHYVIDHAKELQKLIDVTGGGDGKVVLVRIVTPVHDAQYQLSDKFGISAEEAPELLRQVHDAHFQTGVAFHVGSQCRSPKAFTDGVKTALDVISGKKADISSSSLMAYLKKVPSNAFVSAMVKDISAIAKEETDVFVFKKMKSALLTLAEVKENLDLRLDFMVDTQEDANNIENAIKGLIALANMHLSEEDSALRIPKNIVISTKKNKVQIGLVYPTEDLVNILLGKIKGNSFF